MMSSPNVLLAAVLAITGCGISEASAAKLTSVVNFSGSNGGTPEDGPIEHDGQLYGTTVLGGTSGSGSIFQLDPVTGNETVLYNFRGGADGWEPQAGLVYHDGQLFGTTDWGGNLANCQNVGCGVVFRFDIKTGKKTVLYTFSGGTDGATPTPGNLVYLNGKLYGMTYMGGASGIGAVYAVDAKTGSETVLHSFSGTDGAYPLSGLTYANGHFYGVTGYGGNCGANGCGIAFSIDPATGAETILHGFTGNPDAAGPWGNLAYVNGTLYGASYGGGTHGIGAIFSIDASSGAESVLYSFDCSHGALGDGVIYRKGHLYGTTVAGGPGCGYNYTYGAVFDFDLATNQETMLHAFTNGSDGGLPYGTLLDTTGYLYGTTFEAGTGGGGTVFKIKP